MNRIEAVALSPFPDTTVVDHSEEMVGLKVSVHRRDWKITVSYRIDDPADTILWPTQPDPPAAGLRRDGLWETTCMELFIRHDSNPEYWEFNFSPGGAWNAYHFTRYRQNMREEKHITNIPVRLQHTTPVCRVLQAEIDLSATSLAQAGRPDRGLRAGLAAVIQTRTGRLDYYAAVHAAATPDFHHPQSFCLSLAETGCGPGSEHTL